MVYAQGKHSVYDIQYRPNKHQLKKGNTFSIHFYNAGAPTFGVLSKLPPARKLRLWIAASQKLRVNGQY